MDISIAISITAVCVTIIFGVGIWRKNDSDDLREKYKDLLNEQERCKRALDMCRDEYRWALNRVQGLERQIQRLGAQPTTTRDIGGGGGVQ